jgi:hypothetical protein
MNEKKIARKKFIDEWKEADFVSFTIFAGKEKRSGLRQEPHNLSFVVSSDERLVQHWLLH